MKWELNLDSGRAIAYVKGGMMDGEIIHVADVDAEDSVEGREIQTDEIDLLIQNFFTHIKQRFSAQKMDRLHKALLKRERPAEPDLAEFYDKALLLINGSKGKEIILKSDSKLRLTFDPNIERLVFYITGMSGSGKSTLTSDLMENYHKLFPKNEIYLFSNKSEDPALDKHKFMTRVPMNDLLYEEPIGLELIANSLVVFDDIEAIADKNLSKEIDRLRDLILQQGRSYRICFVYISHLANDYKRTRTILNEAHSITVFPQMCSGYSLKYLLDKYLGFGRADQDKLMKLPSRWVCIYKAPLTVIYESGCYLVH